MPNRILRESIWTSESLNSVSLLAEALFLKLLPYADDFGRFDARPAVLLGRVMPLRSIRSEQLETWLGELEKAEMIRFYVVRGIRYGLIPSWDKWNNQRAKTSVHPAPTEADKVPPDGVSCAQTQTSASACAQTQTSAPREEKRRIESGRTQMRAGAFAPPSPDEVRLEVAARGYHVDPEAFVAHYTSVGWKVGKNPMRDWKAALVTWERRRATEGGNGRDKPFSDRLPVSEWGKNRPDGGVLS